MSDVLSILIGIEELDGGEKHEEDGRYNGSANHEFPFWCVPDGRGRF